MPQSQKFYKTFTPLEKAADKSGDEKDILTRSARKSFSKKKTSLTGFTLHDLPQDEHPRERLRKVGNLDNGN